MAMACLRFLTRGPRLLPLCRAPCLNSSMVLRTFMRLRPAVDGRGLATFASARAELGHFLGAVLLAADRRRHCIRVFDARLLAELVTQLLEPGAAPQPRFRHR